MPQLDFLIFCSLCSFVFIMILILLTLIETKVAPYCTKILKIRTKLYNKYNTNIKNINLDTNKKLVSTQSFLISNY